MRDEGSRSSTFGSRFDGQDLSGQVFIGCNLGASRFVRTALPGARFQNCALGASDFTGADLRKAVFDGCDMRGADLSNAILSKGRLRACSLEGASFAGAELMGAIFNACTLVGVDFSGAKLHSALIARSTLEGARLQTARQFHRSRALVSEALRSEAGPDNERLALALVVGERSDMGWSDWIATAERLDPTIVAWVETVLEKFPFSGMREAYQGAPCTRE